MADKQETLNVKVQLPTGFLGLLAAVSAVKGMSIEDYIVKVVQDKIQRVLDVANPDAGSVFGKYLSGISESVPLDAQNLPDDYKETAGEPDYTAVPYPEPAYTKGHFTKKEASVEEPKRKRGRPPKAKVEEAPKKVSAARPDTEMLGDIPPMEIPKEPVDDEKLLASVVQPTRPKFAFENLAPDDEL